MRRLRLSDLGQQIQSKAARKAAQPSLDSLPLRTVAHYEKKAGKKLVIFNPGHKHADPNGFQVLDVELATQRLNKPSRAEEGWDEPRFCVMAQGVDTNYQTVPGENYLNYIGGLKKIDRARSAAPGSEFRGWRRSKQYRLSRQEIEEALDGRIFEGTNI